MAHSIALVDALKRELRARDITYAQVARHLGLSEPSVKRLFSRQDFTLERIDRICQLLGMEFTDLARSASTRQAVISRLSIEQEREFVANPKLMLIALLVLNHWKFQDIVSYYNFGATECIQLLARLDRLRFIDLLPNNRYRPLVSEAFSWIPDGPIQRFFKQHMSGDFFESAFAGENEFLVLANGALAPASVAALMERLRRVAADFAEMRANDSSTPTSERPAITLLLAARGWAPALFSQFRRRQSTPHAMAGAKNDLRNRPRKQLPRD
ncbi:MAG: helix-turn-helix transcriptional regulator [Betaproteobacteria bacterium]|nr:helix-turn-helix transcriptional regulator [Betaproteobacteria bacterium]